MKKIFRNIRVVDAQKDGYYDVETDNGKIISVTESHGENKNIVLMPGFTDLHAHFRDPGYTEKETVKSGTDAAVKGGYTTVNLMPNTNPVCDSSAVYESINEKIKADGRINIYQALSILKGQKENNFEHLRKIKNIKTVSNDGYGVDDDEIMEKFIKFSLNESFIIMLHEQYSKIKDYRESENLMTVRDIKLSEKYGRPLHFCHVSTKESVAEIVKSKKLSGITLEVTPHHIVLNDQISQYKVNPPIRNIKDTEKIIENIVLGNIDAIATDHAPHTEKDKENGAPGISGIETSFQILYTYLVKTGIINLSKLSKLMSYGPSQILRVKSGLIEKDYPADFVIVDTDHEEIINPENFLSKGKNTPFAGKQIYSLIKEVYCGGKKIWEVKE